MMVANKPDKIQQAKNEIREWEAKVQGERDFEQISKTIRKEVGRFEKERVKDFKTVIIKYLESLVQTQQQVRYFFFLTYRPLELAFDILFNFKDDNH